jgi:glutathione synthase/RimK-type ligase-like ATP-grasp enzyme
MILIITNKEDITADYVVLELQKRNIEYVRVNTEDFPTESFGNAVFNEDEELIFNTPNKKIDLSRIKSVWYRRPIKPNIDSAIENDSVREFCLNEARDFLRGLWYSLDCFWLSDIEAIKKAEHKIYQLKIAKELDLNIPKTIISNDPKKVEEFYYNCDDGMIIKPLFIGFIDDEKPKTIYTSEVTLEDLEEKNSIKYAPSIFQEKINKKFDIRVTIIGKKVFAAEIHTNNKEKIIDWRKLEIDQLNHFEHELPKDLENKLISLVKKLGLEFGAIDLAVNEEGEYVFFEINPNGQWAWLEEVMEWPLSKEIVDLLIKGENK